MLSYRNFCLQICFGLFIASKSKQYKTAICATICAHWQFWYRKCCVGFELELDHHLAYRAFETEQLVLVDLSGSVRVKFNWLHSLHIAMVDLGCETTEWLNQSACISRRRYVQSIFEVFHLLINAYQSFWPDFALYPQLLWFFIWFYGICYYKSVTMTKFCNILGVFDHMWNRLRMACLLWNK